MANNNYGHDAKREQVVSKLLGNLPIVTAAMETTGKRYIAHQIDGQDFIYACHNELERIRREQEWQESQQGN